MTPEEIRGRRITIVIALVVGIPPILVVLGLMAAGKPASSIPWFQIVLPVVLSVLLCLGYRWARAFTIFSLLAGSLLLLLSALAAGSPVLAVVTLLVSIPFAAANVTAAIILWRSKAVEAFFDRRTSARDTLPSLRDEGDV